MRTLPEHHEQTATKASPPPTTLRLVSELGLQSLLAQGVPFGAVGGQLPAQLGATQSATWRTLRRRRLPLVRTLIQHETA